MFRMIFLVLIGTAMSAFSTQPDYRSCFNYPDIQLTINIRDVHSELIPFKNHSIPKTTSEIPVFEGGAGKEASGYSAMVYWRFIQKTESGDLYLISITRNSKLLKEVPVLYTGSTVVGFDRDQIKVTFESTRGAKSKAL